MCIRDSRITGYCNGGCQRGWTGVRCKEGRRCINNKSLIPMYIHIVYKLHIIVLLYDDSYIWYIIYIICNSVYWLIASFELDAVRATFQPPRTGLIGQKMIFLVVNTCNKCKDMPTCNHVCLIKRSCHYHKHIKLICLYSCQLKYQEIYSALCNI